MFSLESMNSFDMLFQMLIFDIVLVAAIVGTFEWAGVGVGIQVISESRRSIERFGATRPCTSEGFQIRRKLGPWSRSSRVDSLRRVGSLDRIWSMSTSQVVLGIINV